MCPEVVITGVGLVTPLGTSVEQVIRCLRQGASPAAPPSSFDASPFACRVCCEIGEFAPEEHVRDRKSIRLMSREALLAAAAARFAVEDSGLRVGEHYAPERVGLFGATGLAGLPMEEVEPLLRLSTGEDERFDARRFGEVALKSTRPVLSFRILSNMAICFVSIFEGVRGPNSIFNPWEGQGALAIVEAIRAIGRGEADCCLAGGCASLTHLLGFAALNQHGVFTSWQKDCRGCVPGEGAAFLVLETAARAAARGARVYARLAGYGTGSTNCHTSDRAFGLAIKSAAGAAPSRLRLVSAADGTPALEQSEAAALAALGLEIEGCVAPKRQLGTLFAAAAAAQVGIGAALAWREREADAPPTLVNCFGPGSEQVSFLLSAP